MLDLGCWMDGLRLRTHVPAGRDDAEVLVAVHGISRNARAILKAFRAAAGPRLAVVAPVFRRDTFPDYQRLGLYGPGPRADLALDAALERFSAATGIATRRVHLFGFSGGAQFAHRYAMLHPDRVHSLHVASAGWYTFPDPAAQWPYGLGALRLARPMIRNLPLFLRLPIHVYAGGEDTERDPALRKNDMVDRIQGRTRVDRARNWAKAVAARRLEIVEGAGHDFGECCRPAAGRGLADLVTREILAGAARSGRNRRPRVVA